MEHSLLEKWNLLEAIDARRDLPPLAKVVARRLLHHLNSQSGLCYPSYKRLAKGAGASRRGVIKAIEQLEEARIITKRTRQSVTDRMMNDTNTYDFNWNPGTWIARPKSAGSQWKRQVVLKMQQGAQSSERHVAP